MTRREKRACRNCKQGGVATAPVPAAGRNHARKAAPDGGGAASACVDRLAAHARASGFARIALVAVGNSAGVWRRHGFHEAHDEALARKLASYDEAKIAKMPGVRGVVKVNDSTVAVVADTWWRARTALEALPIVWDEGPHAKASSATIAEHLKEGLTSTDAFADIADGDAVKAIAGAPKKIEAVYSTPFLSHATMEPMTATVRLTADRAEVWVPTQNAEASLAALSTASGLPLDKCEAYPQMLGGGFGRRGGTQD